MLYIYYIFLLFSIYNLVIYFKPAAETTFIFSNF